MNRKRILSGLGLLLILILAIAADQVSKIYVRQHINAYDNIVVIKSFITLTKVENTGAFLSLGDSMPNPWRFIILALLPSLALLWGLLYVLLKPNLTKLNQVGIILILAGGFGNLYDRLRYGSVTDFMHMDFKIFETGVFNVADVFIMIGVGILLLNSYIRERARKAQENAESEESVTEES